MVDDLLYLVELTGIHKVRLEPGSGGNLRCLAFLSASARRSASDLAGGVFLGEVLDSGSFSSSFIVGKVLELL